MSRPCFKCGGSVIREPGIDDDDVVEKCIACGRFQPHRDEEAPAAPKHAVDWRAAALAKYRGILAELQRVTDLREKAAQLRQGLLALGLANVPELPGSAAKAQASAGRTSLPWTPELDAELARMTAEGHSAPQIARTFGRTTSAVSSRQSVLKRAAKDAPPEVAS